MWRSDIRSDLAYFLPQEAEQFNRNMKTGKYPLLLTAALFAGAMTFTSCEEGANKNNDANAENDPKEIAEEHNDAKFNKSKEKEAQFLVDVAAINMRTVKLSELAVKSAVSADVKKTAGKMVTDHNKSLGELKKLAEKKQITLPKEDKEAVDGDYDNLRNKSGKEFDRHYLDLLVRDHKEAVEKMDKASTDSDDYEIKSSAGKMLTELRTHLDELMVLQEKHKDTSDAKDSNAKTGDNRKDNKNTTTTTDHK
jgi:putative membrane protein